MSSDSNTIHGRRERILKSKKKYKRISICSLILARLANMTMCCMEREKLSNIHGKQCQQKWYASIYVLSFVYIFQIYNLFIGKI